jgi:hypothetical protein
MQLGANSERTLQLPSSPRAPRQGCHAAPIAVQDLSGRSRSEDVGSQSARVDCSHAVAEAAAMFCLVREPQTCLDNSNKGPPTDGGPQSSRA